MVFDPTDINTKMKEEEFRPRLKYGAWFEHVVAELNEKHNLKEVPFTQLLEEECESENPIARSAAKSLRWILSLYVERQVAIYASKLVNFYSRLGRNYTPANDPADRYRRNIVVFPIYATTRNPTDQKVIRYVSGICLRGPCHAKRSTDKIQIYVIELLNSEDDYYHDKINSLILYDFEKLKAIF